MRFKGMILAFFCLITVACGSSENYAPVTDLSYAEDMPQSGVHRVLPGETLYEIAWRYGLDYRYLASRNNIGEPYTIFVGQIILLHGKSHDAVAKKLIPQQSASKQPAHPLSLHTDKEPNFSATGWVWPAKGKIIRFYSMNNKGVDIAGKHGQPVYAAASGKIVYSGNGLRSYGNLIIIKHNNLYLSAYAHNDKVLVGAGDWVKKGQKIADMGDTGSDKVMLHFEIRRAGKPVNPLNLYHRKS